MAIPGQRLALLLCCLWPLSAAAAEPVDNAREYKACLVLAGRDAAKAIDAAGAWRARGGGVAADHCIAVALVQSGRFVEAASRLEELARGLDESSQVPRASVLDQAANAWLLADRPVDAARNIDQAVALAPMRPDLLVDQARVRAARDDYAGALAALDLAVLKDPENAEAQAYRASALRHLDRRAEALQAADAAVRAGPGNVLAHLERGLLRRGLGDRKGAREDFLLVARRGEGTPAGDSAQRYLEELDLRTE